MTSHEFAQRLLALPDLPIFAFGKWSGELEEPDIDLDIHGWNEYEDGKHVWRTGQAIVIA